MNERPPKFWLGEDIALKVPSGRFAETTAFYCNILSLPAEAVNPATVRIAQAGVKLWLDKVEGLDLPEIWLEIRTDDTARAEAYLMERGFSRAETWEPLPDGYDGFWIQSPLGLVILISGPEA